MAGNRQTGKKAAVTMRQKYGDDYFSKIGKIHTIYTPEERKRKHREYNQKRYWEKRSLILSKSQAYRDKMKGNPQWRAKQVLKSTKYNEIRNFGQERRFIVKPNCEVCKVSSDNLLIHHIDGEGWGTQLPDNRLENLITLCKSCHYKIHHAPELFSSTELKAPRMSNLLIGLGYLS